MAMTSTTNIFLGNNDGFGNVTTSFSTPGMTIAHRTAAAIPKTALVSDAKTAISWLAAMESDLGQSAGKKPSNTMTHEQWQSQLQTCLPQFTAAAQGVLVQALQPQSINRKRMD